MRSWRIMLGPFLIWGLHFAAVYGLASLEAISRPSTADLWRGVGAVFTGLCFLALVGGMIGVAKGLDVSPLARKLGLYGGGVAALAVVWQSLPLLISSLAMPQP